VELVRHFAGDPERERRYARLAGERAAARFANDEAVRYLSRALELTPADDLRGRYELLLARERAHDLLGRRDAQRQDFAELEVLAASGLGLSTEGQAELLLRLGQAQPKVAAYAEAAQQFDAALEMARATGDQRLQAQAMGCLGRVRFFQYARADAEKFLRESLAIAQEAGDEAT
jgi:predicted ATPase